MIVLGVALEMAQLDLLGIGQCVEQLAGLGVGAIEAQLSPEMRSDEIARWGATIDAAARYHLAVGFHAPLPPEHPAWPELLHLATASPAQLSALLVHGCAGPHPDPALTVRTVDHLRRLADAAPELLIGLENVANVDRGLTATLRAWAAARRRAARARARPSGVGSAMGAAVPAQVRPVLEPLDAPLPRRPRHVRWNAAGSRDATLDICDRVARNNCVFAWDLAHDWIAGRQPGVLQSSVPQAELLRRVGYVRVHDVADSGDDHCLLVIGNVPYTTQLRALLAAGYAGTVCLAARYTAAMRPYGGRWQALERSLNVLKQTLKLS